MLLLRLCLDSKRNEEFIYIAGSHIPTEGNCVIFEIIPYSNGTLHASLEVKDDFKPSDLKLICDCPDASQDSDSIAMLYYNMIFDDIRDKYRDTPLMKIL